MARPRWKSLLAVPLLALHCLNFFNTGYALALPETRDDNVANSRELVGLAQKWNLTADGVEFNTLNFELGYITSDFILDNMVTAIAYTAECKEGGILVPEDDMAITIIPDDAAAGDGDLERGFSVKVDVNAANVATSNIYNVTDEQAIVKFCMRFSLYTPGTNIEVNFLQTVITFTANMTSGFSIDSVNVTPKEILTSTALEEYEVDAYQCDNNNERLSTTDLAKAMNQGEVIRVCVTPKQDALDEGVYMRSIESFEYYRDYGGQLGLVSQMAVENSQAASNFLTVLDCIPGSEVCSFDTILFASMFISPGFVNGRGTALMQFGSNSGRKRRLTAESSHRSLAKEKDGTTATSIFDLDLEIIPGEEFNGVLKQSSSPTTNIIFSFIVIGTMGFLNLL